MNLCFMNTHKKTSENENRNWKLTRKTHYAIGNNNKKPQTLQLVANGKRCCTQWAGISNNHQQCICVYYSFIRFSHPHSHIYSFITHYTYYIQFTELMTGKCIRSVYTQMLRSLWLSLTLQSDSVLCLLANVSFILRCVCLIWIFDAKLYVMLKYIQYYKRFSIH